VFDKDGTLEDSEAYLRSLGQSVRDSLMPKFQELEPLLMAFGIQGDTLNPTGLLAVGSRRETEIAAAYMLRLGGDGWSPCDRTSCL